MATGDGRSIGSAESPVKPEAVARGVARTAATLTPVGALGPNWLNGFRLLFAVLVLYSHCYPIATGKEVDEPLVRVGGGQLTLGTLAVNAFFLISGFLIVRSWLGLRDMGAYFRHRVLRIHPGFIATQVVSLVLATLAATSSWEYLKSLHWREIVYGGVTLAFGTLDSGLIYAHNPLHGAANVSLWTIRLEFFAYIGVAAYGLFGLFRYRGLWLATAGAVAAVYLAKIYKDGHADAWWQFGCYFVVGATCYLFRDRLPRSNAIAGAAAAVLGVALFFPPWFNAVLPFAGGWLLFHCAFLPIPRAIEQALRTDLSYGIYLYAFPVQQTLVHFFRIGHPLGLFVPALLITGAMAWVSWTFVERRCLEFKSRKFGELDRAG